MMHVSIGGGAGSIRLLRTADFELELELELQ